MAQLAEQLTCNQQVIGSSPIVGLIKKTPFIWIDGGCLFCISKIGYDGFSEFKFDMSRYLVSNNQNNIKDKNETSINAITSNYIEYISKINTSITLEEVHALAEKINSSNRVKILE